jgi:chemotaxis protein methyltransferase CheR
VKAPLAAIAELVLRETGFALPAVRRPALLAAVRRAAPGLDPDAFLRATSDPASGRGLVDRLIDQVTNQETTFLRDRGQLDAIEWRRLARGAPTARPGTIRVWSAGCASGEEPYTLALLAAEALGPGHIPVDVLGTDISGAALAAAAVGQYRERAVHALEASLRARYFEPQADRTYLVGQRLRKLVRFRRHNLARDPIPPFGESRFDLVVCRNVLIYFEAPLAEHVIEMLRGSLRPGGVLVLGAADALPRRTAEPPLAQAGQPVRGARPGADAHSKRRPLSDPPGPQPHPQPSSRKQWLAAALDAADKGDRASALAAVASLLADNPLDADAHFVQGLVRLAAGEPASAATALRRALYTDATFALAAFALGRSYDALGDIPAARRSYEQALRTLDPDDHRHEMLLQQVDIGDIASACRARLAVRP